MTTKELEQAKKLEIDLHTIEMYMDTFLKRDINEILFNTHEVIYLSNDDLFSIKELVLEHLEKRKGDLERDLEAL